MIARDAWVKYVHAGRVSAARVCGPVYVHANNGARCILNRGKIRGFLTRISLYSCSPRRRWCSLSSPRRLSFRTGEDRRPTTLPVNLCNVRSGAPTPFLRSPANAKLQRRKGRRAVRGVPCSESVKLGAYSCMAQNCKRRS